MKKVIRSFQSVVSGNFLSREETTRLLPFMLFLSLLALIYIANGYYAEAKIRKQNKLTGELKELHSEYIITKSDLMFMSKQSEVAKSTAQFGIKESVVPPKKIVVQTDKPETHSD
ncbi:MAG: hypothetical protein IT235_02405 [Bacteroidia bacterium]|nr:hypothetical protein [Bacteroidia bacterium]